MPDRLDALARTFASEQSDLLNQTVADGVRLSAVVDTRPKPAHTVLVGCGVTKHSLVPGFVPLVIDGKAPLLHLYVAYVLEMDPETAHLAVAKSGYGLYAGDSRRSLLAHWDYEREPEHRYPSAHLQVYGESPALTLVMAHARDRFGRDCPSRPLHDLHFPVGGRRFRPTLEDVIEFLIVEELVNCREGWDSAVADGRQQWEDRQLRAAIRRNPDVARSAVAELGEPKPMKRGPIPKSTTKK